MKVIDNSEGLPYTVLVGAAGMSGVYRLAQFSYCADFTLFTCRSDRLSWILYIRKPQERRDNFR